MCENQMPKPIAELQRELPVVYLELVKVRAVLERHYRNVLDIEFTFQQGKLWLLQHRLAKRSGIAALRIAVEMVEEGLLSEDVAFAKERISADTLSLLLQPAIASAPPARRILGRGVGSAPGVNTGRICFSVSEIAEIACGPAPARAILVRQDVNAEDTEGVLMSAGVVTAFGGSMSRAAMLCRQTGRPCVTMCSDLRIDTTERIAHIGKAELRQGDVVCMDGETGVIYSGTVPVEPNELAAVLVTRTLAPAASADYRQFERVMNWADSRRVLGVRTLADLPVHIETGVALGAEGVGLCRTEHMFFGDGRIDAMREAIFAGSAASRREALAKILPGQRADFADLFRTARGLPVAIRTLDPALNEFLPPTPSGQTVPARTIGVSAAGLDSRTHSFFEFNPLLGFRGSRVCIVHHEFIEVQIRAVFEAACLVRREGVEVSPELIIPMIGLVEEFRLLARLVRDIAENVFAEQGVSVPFLVGALIELPRACLIAGELALETDFFSLGTNDLTQTVFGISRDDCQGFMPHYLREGILESDPFKALDLPGVGGFIRMAVELGRTARPDLKIGVCGDHAGDASAVQFFHEIGVDYIGVSPLRVAVARLAAAHAATGHPRYDR